MKPIRLTLNGIKSFAATQTIEFAPLLSDGLFAVTGSTGSGKSTILDALIAALYGESNKKNVDNSDLVNTKRTDAEVSFEFAVIKEGRELEYRVVRMYKLDKARKCKSDALLYENGACVAERAENVTKRIEQILGLKKNEFCQCVVLEQGEYARFLNAEPRNRKEIVGNIFSLTKYGEQLSKKVKNRLDAVNAEIKAQESEIAKLTQDSAGLKGLEQELEEIKSRAQALNAREAEADELYRRLYSKKDRYDEYVRKLSNLQARETEYKAADEALKTAKLSHDLFIKEFISKRDEYRAGLKAATERAAMLKAALEDESELKELLSIMKDKKTLFDKQRADSDGAKERLERAEAERARAGDEYKALCAAARDFFKLQGSDSEILDGASGARAQLFARIERYKTAAEGISAWKRQTEALIKEESALRDELDFKLSSQKNCLMKALEHQQRLTAQKDALKACMENNALHAVLLNVQTGGICPVCGNTVENVSRAEHTDLDQIQRGIETAEREYKRAREDAEAYGYECARITAKISEIGEKARAAGTLRAEHESVIADTGLSEDYADVKDRADELCGGLSALGARIASLTAAAVALNAEYVKMHGQAEQTEREGRELSERYKKIAGRLARRAGEGIIGQELIEENRRIKDFSEKETRLEATLTAITADFANAKNRLSAAESAFSALSGIEPAAEVTAEQLNGAKIETEKIKREMKELSARAAETAAKIRLCSEAAEKLAGQADSLKKLQKKGDITGVLYKLVQANSLMEFVAEEYIEQFARDASDIFAALTDGEFQLAYIDSDSLSAKDKSNKTYAIINTFQDGIYRKTSTLSGGETFLVSLSLSLAISNALVKRAGSSPIGFMFIDEGFGTLDNEVINQVMDAFDRIKNDNFTIGLISHRTELTQRIENKIRIVRSENGSAVSSTVP